MPIPTTQPNPSLSFHTGPLPADIAAMRRRYEGEGLDEATLPSNPLWLLEQWIADAAEAGCLEPNAMALSTVDRTGHPRTRFVLCKGVNDVGLRFFTNYESDKAVELGSRPYASVAFFWDKLERQMRIDGKAHALTRPENEHYFAMRPRESQLGAWASPQSQPVAGRAELEALYAEVEARFAGVDVPCPPFWGGYVLVPGRVEAWQGRPGRLHDRVVWKRAESGWNLSRLAP
jgi:pyridoxamine 5'-phosphate oxidase